MVSLEYFKPAHTLPSSFVDMVIMDYTLDQLGGFEDTRKMVENLKTALFHHQGNIAPDDFSKVQEILVEYERLISLPSLVTIEKLRASELVTCLALYLPVEIVGHAADGTKHPAGYFKALAEHIPVLLNDKYCDAMVAAYLKAEEYCSK